MCTAYDAAFGAVVARSEMVDLLLVGDSLAMVVQGKQTTREVTIEQMCYHTEMTSRGVNNVLQPSLEEAESGGLEPSAVSSPVPESPSLPIIGDMPYGTYAAPEAALAAGRRLMESGAHAVKIEGSDTTVTRALVESGIPVMGHLGLLPQTAERFSVQGKERSESEQMKQEAAALEEAGAFAVVLECIPRKLAREISEGLSIPTIGIGAGPSCDGQVLVLHDMLGLTEGYLPKFVKSFAELGSTAEEGIRTYAREVRDGTFPRDAHSYH